MTLLSASGRQPGAGRAAARAVFPCFPREAGWEAREPEAESAAEASPADVQALREQVRQEAFEAGIGEGRAAAYKEWAPRLAEAVGALEQARQTLLARCRELTAELDSQLPRVVLLLARKIVQRELAADDSAVSAVIRQLSQRLNAAGESVTVRIAPRAAEAFEAWRRAAEAAVPEGVRVEPDVGLGPGDWVLETAAGLLDGRIDSQLEEAWRLLQGDDP
jgi:flagellar assembly protein FliH